MSESMKSILGLVGVCAIWFMAGYLTAMRHALIRRYEQSAAWYEETKQMLARARVEEENKKR